MKRKKATIVLCIFAIFIGLLIYFLFSNHDAPIRYDKNIILSNKDAYTIVAKTCYEDYLKNKDTEKINGYTVYTEESGDSQRTIQSSPERRKIYISNEQVEAFKTVVNTYKLDDYKESINNIRIENDFVQFTNERGQTMFIYSPDDKKPYGIIVSNTDNDTYIEKICDNWYYACRKHVILN